MTKIVLRAALLSCAFVALNPAAANHSWGSYHWNTTTTNARFDVLTALSQSHWNSIVVDAVGDWDGNDPHASGTDYLNPIIVGQSGASPRKCNPVSGKIVVCSDSYGFRGWLGIATIWASGNHISQATTKLNDSYHNSAPYNSDSWRRLVACQEIGHDFGLGHQDEDFNTDATQSCMEYTSVPADNETPDGHDYEQLNIIYSAHFNEGSGGGGGGGGGGGKGPPDGRGPSLDPFAFREVGKPSPTAEAAQSPDWGVAVGYDAHGRPNQFELDMGKGLRKITHVTWVPGFRPNQEHLGDHH